MEAWITILLAFGGNAALLAVFVWVGKSLIEKILTRDTLRIENELRTKSDIELEKLRSTLAIAVSERHVRFGKLHEKRAEVVAKTYGLLQDLYYYFRKYTSTASLPGESQENKRQNATDAFNSFIDYYIPNKLFLSMLAVEKIDEINKIFKEEFSKFSLFVENEMAGEENKLEIWNKIDTKVSQEIPIILNELENEFRRLLGDES